MRMMMPALFFDVGLLNGVAFLTDGESLHISTRRLICPLWFQPGMLKQTRTDPQIRAQHVPPVLQTVR